MRFRKKPVEIEAWCFNAETPPPPWLHNDLRVRFVRDGDDEVKAVDIKTLEGTMTAQPGDWIIKGIKGELYPCKPDIFEATYEAVYDA